MTNRGLLVFVVLLFAGCVQHKPVILDALIDEPEVETSQPDSILQIPIRPQSLPINSWDLLRAGFSFEHTNNSAADKFEQWLVDNPGHLKKVVARARVTLPYLIRQVKKNNLPVEIALIPMIESDLNNLATSSSGAAGIWQIMPATGAWLGLKINSRIDERLSIEQATGAALGYLKAFNETYRGNWAYAITAYNAGAGNLNKAIKQAKMANTSTQVWHLPLNNESKNYYSKLIGLRNYIKKAGTQYPALAAIPMQSFFQSVKAAPSQSFLSLAREYKTDYDVIASINAQFITQKLPPRSTRVLVPKKLVHISAASLGIESAPPAPASGRHTIHYGETLTEIADIYQTSIKQIKVLNQLTSNLIYSGQVLLIPDYY